MPSTALLPKYLAPRREKLFGDGRPRPLDRNAKVRIMARARNLMRRTEKGKHYGQVTAKALAVLEALLWGRHNAGTGRCFPSYETIAKDAGCARSTVAEAIKALEDAGILTWVNRLKRVREHCRDLFGNQGVVTRVWRTSNGYSFRDPNPGFVSPINGKSSKSEFPSGTSNQVLILKPQPPALPDNLASALARLGHAMADKAEKERPEGATR
jgi:Helix-turn-helix domain